MSSSYVLRIREAFFGEESIQRTTHACVHALSLVASDPLTIFGNVAIQHPLSCTLTTEGLCPFRADYRIVVPYASMGGAQLALLREIAEHITSSSSTASVKCKHMNGSFSVSMAREDGTVYADAATVLFGINVLIVRAVGAHAVPTDSVLNVTQQRIMATTSLHRSQIARATEMTRRYQAGVAALVQ